MSESTPLYPGSTAHRQLMKQHKKRQFFDSASYAMTGELAPVNPLLFSTQSPNRTSSDSTQRPTAVN